MSDLGDLLADGIHGDGLLAEAADYRPRNGTPVLGIPVRLRAPWRRQDSLIGEAVTAERTLAVRVSDVAQPRRGDFVVIASSGELLEVDQVIGKNASGSRWMLGMKIADD